MPMKLDLSDEETTVLKGVIGRLNVPLLALALFMDHEEESGAEYEMTILLNIMKRL